MKKYSLTNIVRLATAAVVALAAGKTTAQNLVFYEDWTVNHSLDGTYVTNYVTSGTIFTNNGANLADLYFDYSTVGIPLSPNSTNSDTHALRMCANLLSGNVFPTGVSVSPVGFGITDNFDMRFDLWLNFNGPFTLGGSGSTQIGGAGYGTAGTNAQVAGVADCVYIGGSTDGNTASDYRVYSSGHKISYQAGSYRIGSSGTDAAILGDPSSGFVYAGTGGSRDSDNVYFRTNFPAQFCPAAQFALFPQQTNLDGTFPGQAGTNRAGALSFKWRDVSLKKIANTITYTVDGVLIATVDVTDAGPLGGSNILFNMYDINNGNSTDPNRTNLIITLIDNVRITNFANVVSVTNTVKSTAEGSANDGIFTITRSATGVPITVNYTLGGSAVNGVDYTNLSGSVTLSAFATQTNIYVHPVDDSEAETTESVILNITPDPNFIAGGSATITISDNETPVLAITNVSTQMYERTNDFATFRVTRLGNTNTGPFNVNLSFTSGTATYGTDLITNSPVSFDLGVQSTNFNVYALEDLTYEGNETVTVSIAPPTAPGDYAIGSSSSASVTLVDADGPPETVLFSDNFNVDSSANWDVFFATTNGAPDDYTVTFAQDYSIYGIPAAPHGSGDTLGLFMTVNKNDGTGVAAALNAYPKVQNLSGNFALRFDMSLNMSAGGSATEYALFGINHSGTKTNWWRSGGVPAGWTFDGIFYAVETDAQSTPNFVNYSSPTTVGNNPTALTSGTNSSGFTSTFKSPPWAVAGSPAVNRTNTVPSPFWSDVELSKIGDLITLTINKKTIFSYTNATVYTSGKIMMGYEDAFDSIGDAQGNFVFYDNLRVISLAAPVITQIQIVGSNVQIDFTTVTGDVVSQFVLQSASNAAGPYVDTGSSITSLGGANFRSTVAYNPLDTPKFYRVRRAY